MRLRPHRRNLVVWRQSVGPVGRYRARRLTRAQRIRRWIRTSTLLTILGLMTVARAVRARWWPLLAGVVLTVAGVLMRTGPGSVLLLPGLMLLVSAPLISGRLDQDHIRRAELERELSLYSTQAQRSDLEATLDQYPDGITRELRDILARQAMAADDRPLPGRGRY